MRDNIMKGSLIVDFLMNRFLSSFWLKKPLIKSVEAVKDIALIQLKCRYFASQKPYLFILRDFLLIQWQEN